MWAVEATIDARSNIIANEEVLQSGSDLIGSTMDIATLAIDSSVAHGLEEPRVGVLRSPVQAEIEINPDAPDLELCAMAAEGSLAAFEVIYSRYHRRTYSLALRMTSSQTDAEDLTQEVFVQLFKKIGSFRGDSAFSTWLHRMTVNQVLMHFRRRTVKNERTSDDGEMPEQTVLGSANPGKMQIIDRIALKNAIAELPEGYRNVFILHDVNGFEHEEVAKRLGISVGTSKSQLHKARLKLRGLLVQLKA